MIPTPRGGDCPGPSIRIQCVSVRGERGTTRRKFVDGATFVIDALTPAGLPRFMRVNLPTRSIGRATIAVVALYALCLQMLLGALTPVPAQAAPGEVICHSQGSDGAPQAIPHCALACCVAAHHVALAAPVLLAFGLAWDDPVPADRFPPAADESPARAPPDTHASPRGPPQA